MSVSIALVCEGTTDPPTLRALADRIISERVDWVPLDEIDTHRHYRGFQPGDPFLAWQDIDFRASQNGVKSMGHFLGLPLHRDGHAARKAILLLTQRKYQKQPVDAVVFFRDGDRQYTDRRDAILKVRDAMKLTTPIVVGVANRMRECWLLNGFEPLDEGERTRFEQERQAVEFNPSIRAHDLASRDESDARHPKRVLRALTGGDPERERRCVSHTSWDVLRLRGEHSGLSKFIDELESRLVAAFR